MILSTFAAENLFRRFILTDKPSRAATNTYKPLKARIHHNDCRHCMALPDVAKRQQRGYSSDAVWMEEALSAEDVKILQQRAVELEMEGFMSMAS